jgi:hypothetical protein
MEASSLITLYSEKGGELCSAHDAEKEEDGSHLEAEKFYFVLIAEASGVLSTSLA